MPRRRPRPSRSSSSRLPGRPGRGPATPTAPTAAAASAGSTSCPARSSALRAASGAADGKVLVAGSADGAGLVLRLAAGAPDATFGAPVGRGSSLTGADAAVRRGRRDHRQRCDRGRAPGHRGRERLASSSRSRRTASSTPPSAGPARWRSTRAVPTPRPTVAVAGDGSVFVGGNADSGGYVAHYTAAGVPDTGWDGDGRRSGLAMTVSSIALRPDGSVYVGGATTGAPSDGKVLRLGRQRQHRRRVRWQRRGHGRRGRRTTRSPPSRCSPTASSSPPGSVWARRVTGRRSCVATSPTGAPTRASRPTARRSGSTTPRWTSSRRATARPWSRRTRRSGPTTTSCSSASPTTARPTPTSGSTARR